MTGRKLGAMKNQSALGLRLRTSHDVVSAVPYLLGFYPSDSLVAIGTEGPQGSCTLRLDLPPAEHVDEVAEHVAWLLAGNGFRCAVLVGYGGVARVGPIMAAARAAMATRGIEVLEALRVDGRRFWSETCMVPDCCPPDGSPYDITTSLIAVQATAAGRVALTSRAELVRSVAPVRGPARGAMRKATERARLRRGRWLVECGGDRELVRARMADEGTPHVRDLLRRPGGPPSDDEVAWLGVLLTDLAVRDEALTHTDADRLELWRDVLRRVEQPFAAAPGCLTAYAAYLSGDGALANVALDRAIATDPDYELAALLRDIMLTGVPPAKLRHRLEVIACPPPDTQPAAGS